MVCGGKIGAPFEICPQFVSPTCLKVLPCLSSSNTLFPGTLYSLSKCPIFFKQFSQASKLSLFFLVHPLKNPLSLRWQCMLRSSFKNNSCKSFTHLMSHLSWVTWGLDFRCTYQDITGGFIKHRVLVDSASVLRIKQTKQLTIEIILGPCWTQTSRSNR